MPVIAVCLFVLIGAVALTLDISALYAIRARSQALADTAALSAAALVVEGSGSDPSSQVLARWDELAGQSDEILGVDPELTDVSLVVGQWDPNTRELTSVGQGGVTYASANALNNSLTFISLAVSFVR